MDIILGASIIASFFAGTVALFAPCCITILLPAYMASAFREKSNILKMTFIFFGGISVILIPIGLGAAALAEFFRDFHKEMYIFGGVLMIILAVMSVSGRGMAMIPGMKRFKAKLGAGHTKSVFALGMLSGAATSCCAPVLAGAMTLAVISGAFWKAIVVTFAYVFGMTFPLFITAYFYDKFKVENSRLIKGKLLEIKLGAKTAYIHSTNLIAGIMFFTVGAILLVIAFFGNAFWAPGFQVAVGDLLNRSSYKIADMAMRIPDFVWGGAIIGIFLFFIVKLKN